MLRISSSKNRSPPDSSKKIVSSQNLARASSSGIFPTRASDSPNFSADPSIFRKKLVKKLVPKSRKIKSSKIWKMQLIFQKLLKFQFSKNDQNPTATLRKIPWVPRNFPSTNKIRPRSPQTLQNVPKSPADLVQRR